jgi:hypothetical protein
MRQLVICSFTLLIGLPAVGRCQDAEQVCPYAGKCRLQVRICCQKAEKCGQDAKKCCADATACQAKTTACECEAAACQCEQSACPCKAAARVADATACQAKAAQCQAKHTACACKAAACEAKQAACQAKATACKSKVTASDVEASACHGESATCHRSDAACAGCSGNEKIKHLQQAAKHLQAAGMNTEANLVLAEAESLRHDLLARKLAELERLQDEIHQLQRGAGHPQQVKIQLQIAEVLLTNLPEYMHALGIEAGEVASAFYEPIPNYPDSKTTARFTLHHCDRDSIGKVLDALNKQGLAKVLAAPTVVTTDGRVFSCRIGGHGAASAACKDKTQETECKKSQTQIDAVVDVLENGKLRLKLHPRCTLKLHPRCTTLAGSQCPEKCGTQVYETKTDCEMQPGTTLIMGGPIQQRLAPILRGTERLTEPYDVQTIFLVTPELVGAPPLVEEQDCPPPPTAQAPAATRK